VWYLYYRRIKNILRTVLNIKNVKKKVTKFLNQKTVSNLSNFHYKKIFKLYIYGNSYRLINCIHDSMTNTIYGLSSLRYIDINVKYCKENMSA